MALEFLTAGASILGGLGGLFGKKPKQPDIADNMRDQAWGARQAAEKFGFNPLTMLQYGQPAGAGMAAQGASPLASINAIIGGLQGVDDVISGDAARRRTADQLEIDMGQIRLDQARAGLSGLSPAAPIAAGVGIGGSPLGPQTQRVMQTNVTLPGTGKFSIGESPITPGRAVDIMPTANTGGVFELENPWTGDKPVYIPGDAEPWGVDELGTAVVVGAPQVLRNKITEIRERTEAESEDPELFERNDRQRRENIGTDLRRHGIGIGGMMSRAMSIWQ